MAESTESRIEIGAPPGAVMAVVADLEAYPEWNDEVRAVEVLSRHPDGRPDQVRFSLDAGAIRDDYTLAYRWRGDRAVSWSLVEAGMLRLMDGSYELAPVGEDATSVTYRLAVDVRVPMIGMLKRKAEKVIIERALKGLKRRVEG